MPNLRISPIIVRSAARKWRVEGTSPVEPTGIEPVTFCFQTLASNGLKPAGSAQPGSGRDDEAFAGDAGRDGLAVGVKRGQ